MGQHPIVAVCAFLQTFDKIWFNRELWRKDLNGPMAYMVLNKGRSSALLESI